MRYGMLALLGMAGACSSTTAAVQTVADPPGMPGTPSPDGRSNPVGDPAKKVTLTVTFTIDDAYDIRPESEAEIDFACKYGSADSVTVEPGVMTCAAEVPPQMLDLYVTRTPIGGQQGMKPRYIGAIGRQWGGACAGTPGIFCKLDMSDGAKKVAVDFRTAP